MAYRFGSHMSITGGLHNAILEASKLGFDCVQLFTASPNRWPVVPVHLSTKNNNQWAAKPITTAEVEQFRTTLKSTKVTNPLSHSSYLINLASPKDDLWEKSIDAMVIEWQRAEQLGLDGVVMHPGAFVDSSEEQGMQRIVDAIHRIHRATKPKQAWLLLENTAGQGSCLGWSMEQMGWLIERTGEALQVGMCLDTCHAHAAGYDFSTADGFKAWEKESKKLGVLDAIRALHLNDSKKGCGSRVDRHEHIGHGTIGREGFVRVLKHRLLKKLPMYLETDKGDTDDGEPWDAVNLRVLRELAES